MVQAYDYIILSVLQIENLLDLCLKTNWDKTLF